MPNKKILPIIAAVALFGAIGVVAFMQFGPGSQDLSQQEIQTQNEEEMQPSEESFEATGSIDASVDAILSEVLDDNTFLTEEEADASMIIYDDQEVSSFNQTHDETQF